jgi:hypothetical protein
MNETVSESNFKFQKGIGILPITFLWLRGDISEP